MESESLNIEELTSFAIDVLKLSGKEALSYYGKGSSQLRFDEELVTEAELRLEAFFQDQLLKKYPEHQIFINNQVKEDYTHKEQRYLWIYDPLDGIANFQAGIPVWGNSLTLLENFWPILAIFHMPVTDDCFYAQAGKKSFRGKEEISVSDQKDINDESLLLTYSRFHNNYESTFPGKIRDLGCTTAHACYVAMGRADAAIIKDESYNGLAAIRVIIEAAGGKICKMDGDHFLLDDYLDGQKINSSLIVASPYICSEIGGYIQEKP
ncbi:MAG: inositol monophosphatase [Deltaproteobacteria bacterium]|nr:inositol monophosphatase [Deltaproteobacteria bacterium]